MRELIFVHGRAQQNKDASTLKNEWLEALKDGLAKSGLTLPISDDKVKFPYYGDTLYDLAEGKPADEAAQIIVRGASNDAEQKAFLRLMLEEVRSKAGISDSQVADATAEELVVRRGVLNWEWVQGILRAIDRYVPYASGSSIALATNDVYQYLNDSTIRTKISTSVGGVLQTNVESVLVSHSLGTVIAYHYLVNLDPRINITIPLFVTLGSPLAIDHIREGLKFIAPTRCPSCVTQWYNALDERDVVALYPLDPDNFPLDPTEPSIENNLNINNKTENRHGIAGYLDDKDVARKIYDALVAS
jgi:hypothetical protein